MDTSGISSAVSANSQTKLGDAVGIAVLKKALDIEASGAMALIKSIPAAPNNASPDHLGQKIDVSA